MQRIRLLSLLSLAVAACSSGGTIDVGVGSSALADEPPAQDARLLVTVNEVQVHVAGGDKADEEVGDDTGEEVGDEADDGAGWVTIFEGAADVDLFDTVGTEAFLASASVPAGKITQVRIILASGPTLQIGDASVTVACPSCTQTGIKINPSGKLVLEEGETLHLGLVFDLDASMDLAGARLSPVIHLKAD